MARFFQYHASIPAADAIGYSMWALHNLLRQRGQPSFLICQDSERKISVREACGLSSLLAASWRRDDVLIVHHSFFNEHLNTLLDIPIRKILVYHNITPSRFFRDANMTEMAELSDAGRAQLSLARAAIDLAVGDSEYNTNELRELGYKDPATIPVFYDDAFFESPVIDYQNYFEILEPRSVNIVFIGRLVPNKRPEKLVEMVAEYRKLFGPVRLHLIGKIWNEEYTAKLMTMSAGLGVLSSIKMHIAAPRLQVKTILAAADAFVSFSEHEGLMVPLLEAFTVGCPVIAYRAGAIPETMGSAGIGIDDSDPALAAGLIELLRRDRATRRKIIAVQSSRAMSFRSEITGNRWLDFFEDGLGIKIGGSP
jgi:glycosyltransferase involved in cell wall biosynthesis